MACPGLPVPTAASAAWHPPPQPHRQTLHTMYAMLATSTVIVNITFTLCPTESLNKSKPVYLDKHNGLRVQTSCHASDDPRLT